MPSTKRPAAASALHCADQPQIRRNPPESKAVMPSKGSTPPSPYTMVPPTTSPSNSISAMVMSKGSGLSVRKHVLAAAPRFESNRFKVRPRHERVEDTGIDEEFAGPASLRLCGIADGYVNISCAHCISPLGNSYPKHLHHFVSEVIYHLYCNPARGWLGERPGRVAVQRLPGFLIDLGFERRPQ